mmetsp:Transcript_64065/g.202672  ORF Transcript_64065/g.202672 Transcript_64065/m.202672 type:complete len:220 (+) Transcript_64065:2151-2810(+)
MVGPTDHGEAALDDAIALLEPVLEGADLAARILDARLPVPNRPLELRLLVAEGDKLLLDLVDPRRVVGHLGRVCQHFLGIGDLLADRLDALVVVFRFPLEARELGGVAVDIFADLVEISVQFHLLPVPLVQLPGRILLLLQEGGFGGHLFVERARKLRGFSLLCLLVVLGLLEHFLALEIFGLVVGEPHKRKLLLYELDLLQDGLALPELLDVAVKVLV